MAEGIKYRASAWQSEYHRLPHEEALGAGSAGPGKTQCLIHEPLAQIRLEHARCVGGTAGGELIAPGSPEHWMYRACIEDPINWGESAGWALYLRRLQSTLDQTITRCQNIFKHFDKDVVWVASKEWFIFPSGYRYQFGHCKDLGDWQRYYSNEYSIIMFDELSQFDEYQYEQITSRLRVSDGPLGNMLKVRSMSNPQQMLEGSTKVRDPHWVRKRFVDMAPEGRVTHTKKFTMADGTVETHRLIYLPAKLSDNPDPEFVKRYEKTLRSKPKHMQKALLEGDWYVTAGSFFAESWKAHIHTCKPFKVPRDWKFFRSMDWGYKTHGCVHWYAMDDEETLFVIRELTFLKKKAEKVAEYIEEAERALGLWSGKKSLISGWADTQIWEERGDEGRTKAATFLKAGIRWKPADKKRRRTNAERITVRLEDHDNETTDPGLIIFTNCRKLIKTVPGILTDPDDLEVPQKGADDHWYDSLSYGVAGASHGLKGIPSMRKAGSDNDNSGGLTGQSGYG